MLALLRPKQWVKNVFVFPALIFSGYFFDWHLIAKALATFVIFCSISSAVYIINDIFDRHEDQKHPEKKFRPIASGKISVFRAAFIAMALATVAIGGAFYANQLLGLIVLAYFVMNFAYSVILKHIVILDVIIVALGFVLRVVAGAAVLLVRPSAWILVCTILLALFMALAKRRSEIALLGDATKQRKILSEYNLPFLDQMIGVVTASTITAYALYTLWPETIKHLQTDKLVLTLPFVLYAIFRYQYLVYKKDKGGDPTMDALTDAPLIVSFLLWVAAAVIIIYFKGFGIKL